MIGEKIRQIRRAKNISQESLAKQIGLKQTQLSKIERNNRKVSVLEAKKIADAFGVDVNKLLSA